MSNKKHRFYAGDFYWYEIDEVSPGDWVVAISNDHSYMETHGGFETLKEAEAFIRGHNKGEIPERLEDISDEDVEEENIPGKWDYQKTE